MLRHKHKLRLIGIFLSVILSVSSVPLYAFASGTYDTGGTAAEEVTVSCEYVAKRGEFEKHYLLSDGSFVAVSYPEAIHYRNADGEWEDIDSSLHAETSSSRIVTGDCGTFAASFSTGRSAGRLVSLSNREFSLSWSLSGDGERMVSSSPVLAASSSSVMQARAKISDSITGKPVSDSETFALPGASGSVGYSTLFADAPEISAEYTVYRNKIEEDIYINSPTDLRSLRMEFDTAGLTAEVRNDGSVEFLDENGEMRFRIGIPYMEDAANEILTDIHVNAEQNGDSCTVTYTPDEEWLSSSERSYPILFDPSVTTDEYNSNIVDTYVAEGDTANHSGEQKLFYGVKSGKIHRVYIKINDLPAIDASMPVYSATMSLTYLTGTKTGKAVEIRKVDSSWSPTTITYANKPNYSALLGSMTFDASKPVTFNLASDVSALYDEFNAASNYGYVIKYVDEGDTAPDYNGFWSSEYTTASKRPVLTVTYGYSLPSSLTNGSVYSFQNVGSGSFMTVHDGKDANYTNVYQKNTTIASLTASQKFRLEQVPSTGGYLLRAMCSSNGTNRVVDIQRVGTEPFVKSGNNAYLYTATASKTQQWLLVGVGENEFKIVLRNNMNLALTAYGIADGTSGGTSSTSMGNVFVSTYNSSYYQKWRIVDSNGDIVSAPYTVMASGEYYLNNIEHGYYIKNSSSVFDLTVGHIKNLGTPIIWKVTTLGNGECTIQSASDLTKYLAVDSGMLSLPLLSTLPSSSNSIPDTYKWTINGNRIRNCATKQYIYVNVNATTGFPQLKLTSQNSDICRWWTVRTNSFTNELVSISASELFVAQNATRQLNVIKSPSNARWSRPEDFTYSFSLASNGFSVSKKGVVTGEKQGTWNLTVRHKSTGETVTIKVTVGIPSGTYFFQNRHYGKYIQPDDDNAPLYNVDGEIIEQMPFDASEQQKWSFVYLGDDYYKIVSNKCNYAITVPTGKETTEDIDLILTPYAERDTQKWRVTKTKYGSYKIKAKSSEGYTEKDLVIVIQNNILLQNLNVQQREYVDNESYRDEWWIDSMMPTSGSELTYNPSMWKGTVEGRTNCYDYALNAQINPKTGEYLWMIPGSSAGLSLSNELVTSSTVRKYIEEDAKKLGFRFEEVERDTICESGTYKVALFIAPGDDFHWYRQNADGFWSHKLSSKPVSCVDASGCPIFDPVRADRDYSGILNSGPNYSEFIGYFMVTPLNYMVSSSNNLFGENVLIY